MKKVATGVDNFKKIIDGHYYFVDKSMFIEDVIDEDVALYSRPRRFGKTLNMSMLYYFFSINEKDNAYLFDNLEISKHEELMKYQNQYPVIFITLKDMKNTTFDLQVSKFGAIIRNVVLQHPELKDSEYLSDSEKIKLNDYEYERANMTDLKDSLMNLSTYLSKHYHQKVITLIDEYDVPLSNARENNYFEDMASFISGVFSTGLKTNDYLDKGILTGCLRIAKESIFTGLNNFNVYGIADEISSTYFGFSYDEVYNMVKYYQIEDKIDTIKEWYDGYLFGSHEIYNPWSVSKYIRKMVKVGGQPESFWANTSGNSIVREYIEKADNKIHEEFELLINDKSIVKKVLPEITYLEMQDIENIYSFLLYTGYLKIKHIIDEIDHIYELEIPNKEVKKIYENTFNKWFKDYSKTIGNQLINAFLQQDEKKAQRLLIQILNKTISYHDEVEAFYHGFLGGLLMCDGYRIKSNRESGDGRFDLSAVPEDYSNPCLVIECKISDEKRKLKQDSQKAIDQIVEKNYLDEFIADGYDPIYAYGISFYKKTCYITKLKED
ncbi:MAG: ATP-binding protein [Erysipelotrichaceae bacterium]|nr:ATP-binding protein [Erysipelotrichaceae bacterium]